jgi:phosphohistidine phosphatase
VAHQLWLLRHGEAEPHGARPDAERRLTDRGEQQSVAAGTALAALAVTFQAIFTSPRVRARETARLAAGPLGADVSEHPGLAGDFDARGALDLASAGDRILLVGHEPDFGQIVYELTGARVDFKKGGVAGIRLNGASCGELVVLLRPRELDRIAATGHPARPL